MRFVVTRGLGMALAVLLALFLGSFDGHAEEMNKPMIVKIDADWCGTCTKMDPTFEALEKQVGAEALIVVLDVTDKDAVARSTETADRLGIRAFFDSYKSKTGTAGVFTASGEAVVVMKGETDPAKYVAALEKAKKA